MQLSGHIGNHSHEGLQKENTPSENPPEGFSNVISMSEKLFRLDHLNVEERRHLTKKFEDVFYHENDRLTFTNQIKHKIRTKNEDPIYNKTYRYPQKYREEVDQQIEEMLSQGIIRHSNSP